MVPGLLLALAFGLFAAGFYVHGLAWAALVVFLVWIPISLRSKRGRFDSTEPPDHPTRWHYRFSDRSGRHLWH